MKRLINSIIFEFERTSDHYSAKVKFIRQDSKKIAKFSISVKEGDDSDEVFLTYIYVKESEISQKLAKSALETYYDKN
jgi:hypothetical protein